jgi:hypothetical protein
MMTPAKYAKAKIQNGEFPMMVIEAGEHGTFWLHDCDFKMLDCKAFTSKESAEKFRSKVIERASR